MAYVAMFKTSDVARATQMPFETLTRNLDRGVIHSDDKDTGKGNRRGFTLTTAYVVAIGHAITMLGVTPTAAMALANKLKEPQCGRELGQCFPTGTTWLQATPDGVGKIINLQADEDVDSLLHETTLVVNVSKIVATVNERLLT